MGILICFLKSLSHTPIVIIQAWKRPKKDLKKASQRNTTLNTSITYDDSLGDIKMQAQFHFKGKTEIQEKLPVL